MFPKKREVVKRPEAVKILQPDTNVSPFVTHLGQDILRQGSQVFVAHGFGALVSLHHPLSDVYLSITSIFMPGVQAPKFSPQAHPDLIVPRVPPVTALAGKTMSPRSGERNFA
jgi:hypothetical protein